MYVPLGFRHVTKQVLVGFLELLMFHSPLVVSCLLQPLDPNFGVCKQKRVDYHLLLTKTFLQCNVEVKLLHNCTFVGDGVKLFFLLHF